MIEYYRVLVLLAQRLREHILKMGYGQRLGLPKIAKISALVIGVLSLGIGIILWLSICRFAVRKRRNEN